ncbi:MAG: hypothetical protein AAGE52_34550, partial [Myxococcota bacterium]
MASMHLLIGGALLTLAPLGIVVFARWMVSNSPLRQRRFDAIFANPDEHLYSWILLAALLLLHLAVLALLWTG